MIENLTVAEKNIGNEEIQYRISDHSNIAIIESLSHIED